MNLQTHDKLTAFLDKNCPKIGYAFILYIGIQLIYHLLT